MMSGSTSCYFHRDLSGSRVNSEPVSTSPKSMAS
jgi:hypothetical protein